MENITISNIINLITLIFILIIFYSPKYFKNKGNTNISSIASTAVSLGILGTFTGIFIGLLNFNVSDIQGSVPQLLSGLKTAFATSIAGLFTSLLVKAEKWDIYKLRINEKGEIEEDDNIKILISVMKNIEKSIAGEGETTLLTQIQKLRTSNSDNLNSLNNSFNEFAEKVAEDGSKSLIEALESVISDFNDKISEQFGENFKQLNQGVGKMLEWQIEYSNRVDLMTEQFQRTLDGVSKCELALNNISEKSKTFNETSSKLDKLLNNLNVNLVGLNQMSDNTKNIFPKIQSDIKDLTENFSNSVTESLRENNRMLESQKTSIDRQVETLSASYEQLGNQQNKMLNEVNRRLENLMKENATRITEQLKNLDEELAEELNKSLTSLGSQLTSLSNKFVEDYTPLTIELQKLVEISKSIN
jgi:ABC-type transporter Mla subunit MlaD